MIRSTLFTALLLGCFVAPLSAESWPNWRGPSFNGSSTETGLPATFSRTENVVWKADVISNSASVPVVHKGHVYLTGYLPGEGGPAKPGTLRCLCLDAATGRELWKHDFAGRFQLDDRSNLASPSAAANDERVLFFFGTGDLLSFSHDGTLQWHQPLAKDHYFAFQWSFSTSPVLFEDKIYIQICQRDSTFEFAGMERGSPDGDNPSFLLALKPSDGTELWRVERPSKANAESLEAFSTPTVNVADGRREIIIAGGDCLTGHDLDTGREIWRWGTWNPDRIGHWRLVPSPVVGGDVVLACAPKKEPIYAISRESNKAKLAWKTDKKIATSDVSTPLFYEGRFYVVDGDQREKALICLKPDGTVVWRGLFDSKAKIEASPTGADGKIYVMDHSGRCFVAKAGDQFELLHQVDMAKASLKDARGSMAVADGKLFLRVGSELFCFSE